MSLYDVAREVCHEQGIPWTDPRTGKKHEPPQQGEVMEQTYVELTGWNTQNKLFLAPSKILAIERLPAYTASVDQAEVSERTKITGSADRDVWLVVETPEEVRAAIALAQGGSDGTD